MSSQGHEMKREKTVPSEEFSQYFEIISQLVNKAITLDEQQNYVEAADFYKRSLETIEHALGINNFNENMWKKAKIQKNTMKSWKKSCTERKKFYICHPEKIPKRVPNKNIGSEKQKNMKRVNKYSQQKKVKYVQNNQKVVKVHPPQPKIQNNQQNQQGASFMGNLKQFLFGDLHGQRKPTYSNQNMAKSYGSVPSQSQKYHVRKPVNNNYPTFNQISQSTPQSRFFIPKNNVQPSKNTKRKNEHQNHVNKKKKKPKRKKNREVSKEDREHLLKGVDKKLLNSILDDILSRNTNVKFDDIAGLEDAKQIIHEAVILPQMRPDLFCGLRKPPKGVLLFGPPGNGKTLLGKAAANECDCKFFAMSASSLVSKWHGESEKMAKALFAAARYLAPSIIFIDEIDSILSSRSSNEHEASRRLKTEFLVQIDGVSSEENSGVLVMGATNTPEQLDDAILRRFTKRVYVPLPNFKARIELIGKLLSKSKNKYKLSKMDFKEISKNTDGYSGSDLAALCSEASMQPLRELGNRIMNINQNDLRSIEKRDFMMSIKKVKPSTNMKVIKQLHSWNEKFGSV